jgi:hypothetical protein
MLHRRGQDQEDPLAAVEVASRISGTRTIEMWRPPTSAALTGAG